MTKARAESSTMMSRRFSGQFRWLFAEMLIVVMGVFIALAIDEWRQKFENDKIEQEYLLQLIADLSATEESVTESSTAVSVVNETLAKLADAFKSNESISSEKLSNLIYASSGYNNPAPVLGTIDALVATGDLRLIRNERTRSAITQYLSFSRDVLLGQILEIEQQYSESVFRLSMLAAADGILYSKEGIGLLRNTEPDVEAFLANYEAYGVVLRLVNLRSHFEWHRGQLHDTAKELREILEDGAS